ncbi:autotransporter domain-containing protein [Sebaldella sp. S0638]|uniref:autotransporter domain-containing protein n=1 Tax=Sebaldella sp. S0638 TaxID=2957809 RepID=UPI00209FD0CE|nr:autotransporter domain-containing protein [Sebaldella sp. S0638]MCP1223442.1 autotransporter domain-containing protein [Sebaldella sp. S0638]
MKNKRLLLSFLALYSMTAAYAETNIKVNTKLDKIYKNLINDKGVSEKDYGFLEEVLNKRNKELKDLYEQSDYIVKPEYLEWQIFFSGFYDHVERGDNTKANAKYHSDPSYSKNGIQGKVMQGTQVSKEVDLGIRIPMKAVNRTPLDLAIQTPPVVEVNPAGTVTVELPSINVPVIEVPEFEKVDVSVAAMDVKSIFTYTVNVGGSPNADQQGILNYNGTGYMPGNDITSYHNAILSQQELVGGINNVGRGTLNVSLANNSSNITATVNNTMAYGNADENIDSTLSGPGWSDIDDRKYVMKLVGGSSGGHILEIDNMDITYTGNDIEFKERFLFYTDAHNKVSDNKWIITDSTNITLSGQYLIMYGAQYHSGDKNAIMENNGVIRADNTSLNSGNRIIFAAVDHRNNNTSDNDSRFLDFYNNGTIILEGKSDVLANFGVPSNTLNQTGTSPDGGTRFINSDNGDVSLKGLGSIGIVVKDESQYGKITNFGKSEITFKKSLELTGDETVGVYVENSTVGAFNPIYSSMNMNIGTTGNESSSTGNSASGKAAYTENAAGFYTDAATLTLNLGDGSSASAPGTHNILFGDYARSSSLVRADGGTLTITGKTLVNKGEGNIGLAATGGNITLNSGANLTVSAGNGNAGAYAQSGGTFTNNGTITVSGNGTNGVIAAKDSSNIAGNIINNSTITKENNGAAVVLAGGNFTSTGRVETKNSSAGIYASSDVSSNTVSLTGDGVVAGNKGIAFYAGYDSTNGTTGRIQFGGTPVGTIQNGGLMFYNNYSSSNGAAGSNFGQFIINSGTSVKVESGGTVFKFDSATYNTADFSNYLNNTFNGSLGNLTINMPTSGNGYGNLFVLGSSTVDLTSMISTANNVLGTSGLTINGNYRFALLTDGVFNINNDSTNGTASNPYDLNNTNNPINLMNAVNSKINITSGTYITGTANEQNVVKQVNKAGQVQSDIAIVNDGNINMSGTDSVSLYSVYGDITNNGTITVSNNAIGVLGLNNTKILNSGSGTVNVGNNSIGLAGITYDKNKMPISDSAALGYGSDKVDITNNGYINDISGQSKGVGIYAENNNSTINRNDVQALNTGTLNFINSTNSAGAYVTGGTFTNTNGQINVGSSNAGIYANNSDVNFNSGTVELSGNNAVGFYLENNSNFTGTSGTINITGQNAIIFNIKGTGSNFSNNLTINSSAGSSYVVANIDSGLYQSNVGNYTIGDNGVMFSGIKSAVLLDSGTTITGTGTNSVALYGNGLYSAALASPYSVESENQGTITMGDSSAGIYVVNGARALNKNNISVGNSSVGMYGLNSGTVTNEGIIEIGTSSQGIYAQNTGIVTNKNIIRSTSNNAVGIYAEGNMDILNELGAEINLSGDNSIGIFSKYSATSTAVLTNAGTINIGNSTNAVNPGLGIYSENTDEKISNTGKILVGTSSIGIYKSGSATGLGSVEQNGEITVGDGGIGIYSDGDTVNILGNSKITLLGGNETAGVYGINGAKIVNGSSDLSIGSGNYGFILNSGASFENNVGITLGNNEVLVYSDGGSTITNNGNINMTGSENVVVYAVNGETVNNIGTIDASNQIGNIAVYNKGGVINNSGTLYLGNSDIQSKTNTFLNTYAVGLYSENSSISNSGTIHAGTGAVAIYSKTDANNSAVSTNKGDIYLTDGAVGLYAEGKNTQIINDKTATITVSGDGSIGMAAVGGALITNKGTIDITGTNSYGMYGNAGSEVENYGTINVGGENNTAILLANSSRLINNAEGTINILGGAINGLGLTQTVNEQYVVPSIVNSGVINVNENFKVNGVEITIKVDPSTITSATLSEDAGAKYVSNAVKFNAPSFEVDENNPVVVTADFTQGTNATTYKLKDVFNPTTSGGGPNTGTVPVVSKSLTWEAIPQINSNGNVDIWMKKIPYDKFTGGLWYEDFGKNLDKKYGVDGISSNAINIFNKIDYISNETDFRHVMASLAGNVYSNLNQREDDIARIFENSLDLLQNSENNTKENVKINVIVGSGKRTEDTDGVVGYDYKATGIQALREVERTYRHTFGYSLGYMHTGFEFNDGNNSEEWVDTIQLGVHNKYKANDWIVKNDLTGRASIHNVDRNIDWPVNGRSEMDGTFETYSLTFDNSLGKEFKIGRNSSVTPYGGLRAMYAVRPTFTESGLEALEVDGNDAWSVKPRAGVEVKGEMPLGARGWKAKATLDLAYEYELANLNEREKARLIAVEDGYHNLSKPEEEKGAFRSKASVGVEVEEKYGIFVTGEYVTGEHSQEDYRVGVSLKAVF